MKKDQGKDEVTDVDRKRHKQMAAEIKERLNKPLPRKPKTFEEFYKVKKKHAKHLEKTYQRKLKKGVKLSIQFEGLKAAEKRGNVKFTLDIRTNTLHIEDILDSDWNDSLTELTSWKNIKSEPEHNEISFLLKQKVKVPQSFVNRVNKVKTAFDEKLKILFTNQAHPTNAYAPRKHTVYILPDIIAALKKGNMNVIDKITHELDHAVRVGGAKNPPY